MNKLDRYDAIKLIEARKVIDGIRDYNNIVSSPLYKKLNTVVKKNRRYFGNRIRTKFAGRI